MPSTENDTPLESVVQTAVAAMLDELGVLWCHVANEGRHKPQYRRKLARLGLKSGVPDCLVFSPSKLTGLPCAIELKRRKGGRLSDPQRNWLEKLEQCAWTTAVCYGLDQAVAFIEEHYR